MSNPEETTIPNKYANQAVGRLGRRAVRVIQSLHGQFAISPPRLGQHPAQATGGEVPVVIPGIVAGLSFKVRLDLAQTFDTDSYAVAKPAFRLAKPADALPLSVTARLMPYDGLLHDRMQTSLLVAPGEDPLDDLARTEWATSDVGRFDTYAGLESEPDMAAAFRLAEVTAHGTGQDFLQIAAHIGTCLRFAELPLGLARNMPPEYGEADQPDAYDVLVIARK